MSARIPRKKGQPANSKKHSDLYTDENPKGTIHGLKFATVDDAKASVAKIKNSGRSHAHKIQAAIAMEQRARVMGKKGPAAVYRKYINAMKKKTKEMQKEDAKALQKANDKQKAMTKKERLIPDRKLKNLKISDVDSKKNVGDTRARAMARRAKKRGSVLTSGLWDNIRKKRERIKRGSGERMRKPGEKGAPTADALARAKTERLIPDRKLKNLKVSDVDSKKNVGDTRARALNRRMKKRGGTLQAQAEEITGVGSIPNPADTAMGPRFKTTNVTDRRRRKDQLPVLLKRFRKYVEDVNEAMVTTGGVTHTPHRTWTAPKPHEEHDEVHTQQQVPHGAYPNHVHKMLDHLADKDNYQSAMKKAKTVIVNKINAKKMSNTDAASSKPANLEKEKNTRVKKQFASGKPMQKPIVLHDTHTGHMHLLAGNTRLTHNTHGKHPGAGSTPVHAIQYDSSKM